MFSLGLKDAGCVLNMIEAIDKIEKYTEAFSSAGEFESHVLAFDACLMNFILIGEMVERISDDLKHQSEPEINWYRIKGFRNIIAHNYFGVDAEEVWDIIKNHLPTLKVNLQLLVNG